ncbi:MAG: site-specific integrase [Lachnospiraceae bacterium]|nr:site-specific integrase [Lachnospiraceae bacterium]
MAVFKDEWNGYNGNAWRVVCYYKDWKGIRRRHEKRGFPTRKEALAHEREFMAKKTKDINMGFGTFIDIYMADMKPQLKASTMANKENIIEFHIRPYFENRSLAEINATDILQWQNELLSKRDDDGKGYSQTFLRTVNNQLNAIFNHAVKYYDLPKNPCLSHKKMGKSKAKEMKFWTKDEYLRFSETMKSKPISYYAFQILYWTGIRCGELLALTKADFDLKKRVMTINKNYQIVKGKEMITSPKTEKSIRQIDMPSFLCKEMEEYFDSLYKVDESSRIFEITKSYLHHEMNRGSNESGVKRIRIHDLRHSSCALLIELGYSPVQIAERLGHESITVTERYSHLYPSAQKKMADSLDKAFNEEKEDKDKNKDKDE